jgi:hypothetical protein
MHWHGEALSFPFLILAFSDQMEASFHFMGSFEAI